MKSRLRRLTAFAIVLLLFAGLLPGQGHASASGVYFTAANENLMELSNDTMPFYSNGVLYVSSRLFEGTDLGVSYARHTALGLATLYTSTKDLRFDLAGQVTYDKQNNFYSGYAVERSGIVFFPLKLVCQYFDLTWSYNETDFVPLIRVKSDSVVLSDRDFIYAATSLMSDWYNEYRRGQTSQPGSPSTVPEPPVVTTDPPVQAAEGQKVYLLFDSQNALELLSALEGVQATFLLTAEDMDDGNLLRALVAGGHAPVLRLTGETEEEAAAQLLRGQEALWQAACARLELIWNDSEQDLSALIAEAGCVQVSAGIELSGQTAPELLRTIGGHREDVAVYLGGSECLTVLPEVLDGLREGGYHLSIWRLTA